MNTESTIDKKYREFILQKYFKNPVLKGTSQCPKWVSPCPFCSSARKSESKRNEKVAALLWNETQRSWVFTCRRKACLHRTLSFPNLIERLDAQLFLEYQQESFHAGSTGFQTNCPNPAAITALKSSRPFPGGSRKSSGSHGNSNATSSSRSHQNQTITQDHRHLSVEIHPPPLHPLILDASGSDAPGSYDQLGITTFPVGFA